MDTERTVIGAPSSENLARGKKRALRSAIRREAAQRTPADELLLAQEKFLFLAEALPEIIWTGQPDGTIDFMNSRWFEYTGLTEAETYGETRTAVHPDDYDEYKRRWKEAVETRRPYEMEYRFRRASDGMYRWHLGRGVPVRDAAGRVLKWFGTCTDIHDQKLAEEEVRNLNEELEQRVADRTRELEQEIQERMALEERDYAKLELLRTIIDTMPIGAAATDSRHAILHANDAFRSLFATDHSPDSLVGMDCVWLIRAAAEHFGDAPEYRRALDAIEAQPGARVAADVVAKDGRSYAFEYLPIAEGQYSRGHLLLVRDVSQERKINRAKTEFMSLASHQLRTPLTSVRWALNRLGKKLGKLPETEYRLLERARNGIMSMADTITTMLSISRIEAGMMAPHHSMVELNAFFEEIASAYSDVIAAKRLAFRIECPPDISLCCDPKLLREILENLLSNAMKYTPAAGTVNLRARKTDGAVTVVVSDTGYGIPDADHQRVFTKFFRAENVMRVETEGTGLGLYLVAQLVRLLGGSISFTSKLGEGTVFVLSFPPKPPVTPLP